MQPTTDHPRRIVVVPYDPHWPEEFERASSEAVSAMGTNLLAIHHIGSTSIPGIFAKPIIDMLAVVADLSAVDRRNADMERLGYEAKGEFGIEGRRYFRRDDSAGRRTHHIHTFEVGSPHVRRHLAFRDFLRAHPAFADQYGALKQKLAEAHPNDMQAYMAGKDDFIKQMEARALEWIETPELSFRTIDLARDADIAVAFRRDSYICSFGSDEAFGEADSYLDWLSDRISRQPAGHVHVWNGSSIIGQIEMIVRATTPITGYVNLFYLAPEARGRGFGEELHRYAVEFMREGGAALAQLCVSPGNSRAIAYYLKHSWRDIGPRPDDSSVRLMELSLDAIS